MKCIYCNSGTDLTVSDIIPWALTGAKVQKRFVCHTHNSFTNENYEKAMIKQFDFFRNLVGLSERDGDPVRFTADLTIDGYTFEHTSISDKSSIIGTSKRKFSTIGEDEKKIVIGDKKGLLEIKGATEDNIKTINMADVSISARSDLRELFISIQVLHAVAKIAYEWHCFKNNIESYDESKYSDIVSYILTPESNTSPIEVVVDGLTWHLMDSLSRTGTNMLFEYQDGDGYTYVIFGFWDVFLYKVRVCKNSAFTVTPLSFYTIYTAYLFHVDGTKETSTFEIIGTPHILAEANEDGLSRLCPEVKRRLSKLGDRDLSREYIKGNVEKIKKSLSRYKEGKCSFAELLDYEADDRIISIFILELLSTYRHEYDSSETFNQNMVRILNTDTSFGITKDKKQEILEKYLSMDKAGSFSAMLEESISFFETNCLTK